MDAEMLCGMLRANGIVCDYRYVYAEGGMLAAAGHAVGAGPIEVQVEEEQLAEARTLLPRDDSA